MKIKMICGLLAASIMVTSLVGCSSNNNTAQNDTNKTTTEQKENSVLNFQKDNYTVETINVNGTDVTYRAYENIVYVENPVDTKYQSMNIYVPEAYFNGESIGSFDADTAPIFMPNQVGGYMPAEPGKPSMEGGIDGEASRMGGTSNGGEKESSPNSLLMALSKGYIVASPGARGRTNQAEDGTYYGKAPAGIVDLKAAVRYLHYNDDAIPGTADKIISNGTSAGGAMSALLGATGNSSDYDSYLKELGAADASDAVFAASCYCPITNVDNADMGYEWLFNGLNDYVKMNISKGEDGQIKRERVSLTQTAEQIGYSDELKAAFPAYVNSLNLKDENGNVLTLDESGNGTFKDYVKSYVMKSAQTALDAGTDLSENAWIKVDNGTVTDIDFEGYLQFLGRSKATPAFDAVDLTNYENGLFGTSDVDAKHFTQFGLDNDTAGGTMADAEVIKLMNPMNYIGEKGVDTAKYWRIRHGVKDSDTAISTPTILALDLENNGSNVDYAIPWGQGHGGDYDLDELFTWMESISK